MLLDEAVDGREILAVILGAELVLDVVHPLGEVVDDAVEQQSLVGVLQAVLLLGAGSDQGLPAQLNLLQPLLDVGTRVVLLVQQRLALLQNQVNNTVKEMFYLTTHSTLFIYS